MALLASPLLLPTITTPAAAACSGGASIVCDTTAPNPHPTLIGGGSGPEGDNTSVEIRSGATVDTGNGVAISLRDNANIRVLDGGSVQARSVDANGPFNTGGNTIEFRDNGVLTVERGGSVLSLGTEYRAEAVNLQGTGSLVVNDGLIRADNAAAIWIQSFSGLNTIVNNATGIIQSPGTAIGFQYPDNDPGGVGNAAVDFTNRGLVIGNVILANGDDNLRLYTGSSITGLISGGDGYDRVFLNGTGSGSIAGAFPQFEELTKADSGTWTLTSPLSGVGLVRVQQGTLALTGDNSAYAGQTLVERAGILEANALSLPLAVVNDGLVRFVQPTGGTYAGLISGLGWVEKTGAGTLFLAPASGGNTYGGGTILTGGTLAIGADSALGAPGAALVFNGGTIRFGDNLTLAPSRAVSILAPGGTIDTAGFRSVIDQGITGSGGLAITGGGVLVLSGANTYTGGTTIGAGTLQLGNGGTTGSLVGDVANAGTLAFNRADTATFAGVVSGTGALRQDGTGTTVLTGANTYTGGTTIGAGTLQLGNGGTTGSLVGDVANAGTLAFNRADTATFAGVVSGTGALRQDGTGTTVLTGANTYTGGTTIGAGTLQLGNGGTTGSLVGGVANAGTLAFNRADTATFAGVVSGTGALRQDGTGTTVLTGANTYTGGTTIGAGTLQLGNGGTTGSLVGDVANAGTLAFNRADTATFAGVVSGTGALRQDGTGTTVLTGANTYTGGTTIGAGTLQLGNGGTTGSLVGDVANAGTLAFNRADTATFAGVVSGTGALRQDGTGTTVLTGANTYTGATRVGAGILRAGGVGVFSAGSAVEVRPGAELDLAGFAQTVGGLANAGLVSMGGLPGNTLTVAGNLVGQGGTIAMNTVLGGDSSATDRVVIQGGTATGDTVLRITNAGGSGAQTVNGIRLVETVAGGTTSADAFRLGNRVAAGAYEYQLSRGGVGGANDWYLRSFTQQPPVVDSPTTPVGDDPVGPGSSPPPVLIPLYRPEVALYAPIPALARQMATFTLGTLHERVGDEENIRDLRSSTNLANGGWARAFGERVRNRWDGTVDSRAEGNLIAVQAGFDVLRYQSPSGHRDHAGFYVAYSDYNASSVSGFSLGQRNADVGRLLIKGPAVGAYWTHFGPTGWYVDAVVQGNWYDVKATSNADQQLNTDGTGVTASVEAGYPISLGQNWKLEPQAQVIWQQVSIGASRDGLSSVSWDEGQAVMGRVGARLQYTVRDALTLWQPYAKVNLWHGFSGTDRTRFGVSDTVDNRFGDTSIEVGAGVTARITRTTSLYAHADYRRTIDDGRSWQDAVQGSLGIRVNW